MSFLKCDFAGCAERFWSANFNAQRNNYCEDHRLAARLERQNVRRAEARAIREHLEMVSRFDADFLGARREIDSAIARYNKLRHRIAQHAHEDVRALASGECDLQVVRISPAGPSKLQRLAVPGKKLVRSRKLQRSS